jgi:hypothetical protein
VKHNLTTEQRKLLVAWAAEGLQLWEINERAAKCGPPFEVQENQLKHVRRQANKRYSQLREEFEREALNEGLARRAVRLREKMERHALLKQVIGERGQHVNMQDVAGGKTGLLVREYKGHSDLPVYKVDAALLKELRDLEKEIAIELGQWAERKEVSGPDGGAIPVSITDLLNKVYGSSPDTSGD